MSTKVEVETIRNKCNIRKRIEPLQGINLYLWKRLLGQTWCYLFVARSHYNESRLNLGNAHFSLGHFDGYTSELYFRLLFIPNICFHVVFIILYISLLNTLCPQYSFTDRILVMSLQYSISMRAIFSINCHIENQILKLQLGTILFSYKNISLS